MVVGAVKIPMRMPRIVPAQPAMPNTAEAPGDCVVVSSRELVFRVDIWRQTQSLIAQNHRRIEIAA
jgi:hypothetical protein